MDYDQLKELLKRDRSVRRFIEDKRIETITLERLVELTRFCGSGRNLQPLRYKLVAEEILCEAVFPLLAWAGYLPDWDGPEPGERPSAYIVQCLDTRLIKNCLCDDGLQLQAITLGATALGLGGCIIKSFNAGKLREVLGIPDWAEIRYVYALGYPRETVVIEDSDTEIKYYRTPDGTHHVPKRSLHSLLLD